MKSKKQLLTALAVLLTLGYISASCTDEGESEELFEINYSVPMQNN
ncbi:MAG: hypothetical protein IJ681_01500 [Bacteroidales bacterium]|nr:hypothetical protein [Bacteroidales bacterium]